MRCVAALGLVLATLSLARAECPPPSAWSAWSSFRSAYLQADGRVIDHSLTEQPTVSEGSGYAAFLALVADDRRSFDAIERWVRDNLAAGDLTQRLPAWRWGQRDDGSWGVLDANSASDADLWLAYDFLEAGRLWGDDRLTELGRQLARRILDEEVTTVEGLGSVLLPGRSGFVHDDGSVRTNPSYAPSFLLARLAAVDDRYQAVAARSEHLLEASIVHGFVPDWVDVWPGGRVSPADGEEGRGSYNAIRVYLWVAMSTPGPAKERMLRALKPIAATVSAQGWPEWFDPRTGESGGHGGRAHAAALLPFLKLVSPARYAQLRKILKRSPVVAADGRRYYGDVLGLFALGADEGRLAFAADGHWLRGGSRCPS